MDENEASTSFSLRLLGLLDANAIEGGLCFSAVVTLIQQVYFEEVTWYFEEVTWYFEEDGVVL